MLKQRDNPSTIYAGVTILYRVTFAHHCGVGMLEIPREVRTCAGRGWQTER